MVELCWGSSLSILEELQSKSSKTRQEECQVLLQAVQRIQADHRLILSGTPIQNNVQELWVLFNFLMPGFLGTEQDFNQRFGKAFKSGRAGKAGSNEAQAGLLAMDGLHRQVFYMPAEGTFLLN